MEQKIGFTERMCKCLPEFMERISEQGIDTNLSEFDELLGSISKHEFKYTKIFSYNYYEAILDKRYGFIYRRSKTAEDNEDMNFEDDYVDEINDSLEEQSEKFSYEISEISDVFIVTILDYVLDSENRIYIKNLNKLFKFYTYARSRDTHREGQKSFLEIIKESFRDNFTTLKIKSQKRQGYKEFMNKKNSYLFEFMYLNNIPLTTEDKANNIIFREIKLHLNKGNPCSIKEIKDNIYDSNLIVHYKKAMTSNDPFSKYLSFYHIIEYYFDRLYNDYIVNDIRNWINDPGIDLNENSTLLKLVDQIKAIKGKSSEDGQGNEDKAFELVLEKYVDISKLKHKLSLIKKSDVEYQYSIEIKETDLLEFYKNNSVNYISGDLKINFNDNDNVVIKNLKNRIYKVRNSLVHSKDNYKFKTYHPYDNQNELIMELPLIKLVAEEIIINSSVKSNN